MPYGFIAVGAALVVATFFVRDANTRSILIGLAASGLSAGPVDLVGLFERRSVVAATGRLLGLRYSKFYGELTGLSLLIFDVGLDSGNPSSLPSRIRFHPTVGEIDFGKKLEPIYGNPPMFTQCEAHLDNLDALLSQMTDLAVGTALIRPVERLSSAYNTSLAITVVRASVNIVRNGLSPRVELMPDRAIHRGFAELIETAQREHALMRQLAGLAWRGGQL